MTHLIFISFIGFLGIHPLIQDLEIIKAEQVEKSSDKYEHNLEAYKTNEFWAIWSMPIGDALASSELKPDGPINYSIHNISDYDLNTAWIEGKSDYGIGETFEFIFAFPESSEYAAPYEFYGIVNVFNGYCKSLQTWQENSRVRKLKVYLNDTPVCMVELLDTWHFQSFDIRKFFKVKSADKYMDAPFEITKGDRLTFEIADIYAGSKYKDVAISEFMAEGAGN